MSLEYREALASAVDHYRSAMPDNVIEVARLALADLYDGPVYIDADGDECSPFDEGARRFSFGAACKTVGEWADTTIQDATESCMFEDEDDEGESVVWEESFVVVEARDIVRALFGELANYL